MKVQLDHDVPVFSVVLTPRDFHDHADHQACLQTLASLQALPQAAA